MSEAGVPRGSSRGRWTLAFVTALSLVYWEAVTQMLGAAEPWDSPSYLPAYLLALTGCAAIAALTPERAWRWGIIVIFAQLPVLLAHSGAGALLPLGVLFLAGQALPAVGLALAFGALRKRIDARNA